MKNNLTPMFVLILLTAGYALFVFGGAPQLPDRVAIHFGLSGQADGWANRDHAILIFEALMVVPAIFLLLAAAMEFFPNGAFNLPNRDYWLAPERRAQTVAAVSRQMIGMGCLMVLFLAGIFWLTIEANRLTPPRLPMNLFLPLLIGFLAATAVWTIRFLRRFKKPPA